MKDTSWDCSKEEKPQVLVNYFAMLWFTLKCVFFHNNVFVQQNENVWIFEMATTIQVHNYIARSYRFLSRVLAIFELFLAYIRIKCCKTTLTTYKESN